MALIRSGVLCKTLTLATLGHTATSFSKPSIFCASKSLNPARLRSCTPLHLTSNDYCHHHLLLPSMSSMSLNYREGLKTALPPGQEHLRDIRIDSSINVFSFTKCSLCRPFSMDSQTHNRTWKERRIQKSRRASIRLSSQLPKGLGLPPSLRSLRLRSSIKYPIEYGDRWRLFVEGQGKYGVVHVVPGQAGEADERIPPGRVSVALSTKEHGIENEKPPLAIPQDNKLLTIPTVLTLVRVAAVPLLVAAFYISPEAATAIFVLAALTDWLDGYLARKLKSMTAFGAFLDPVADKLMVAAALLLLCTDPQAMLLHPWVMAAPSIAIIGREITMSAVREWAAAQGGALHQAVAVNSLGKWKTASQMTSVVILLAVRHCSMLPKPLFDGAVVTGVGLLYVSSGLALWSLAEYLRAIWGPMFGRPP
eukprot:TRINITY_DN7099_c0_g1_i1.p1 TRINITY_DN7099_c0_g1~~TRINITY_DN7099_c0_g1_i1.p1  ORF type:complete len:422 (+),score=37.77 TRINITY_DN7099_c0_g1_i1:409-1674(+)